jgi:uncharacterized RDD family membrane protein YckC
MAPPFADVEYVGFWSRTLAALVDSVLLLVLVMPAIYWWYGPDYFRSPQSGGAVDFLLNFVLPMVAIIAFWIYRQATPGKMLVGARIVDASSGLPASTGQLIGRYVGYYISIIPLCLGLLWVAFDARKQGWHDKLARTVVVRDRKSGASAR